MIPSMPLEDEQLIFNFILLSILQKKLIKELEDIHHAKTENILNKINNDLKEMKYQMQQKQINVVSEPKWINDEFLYYPFVWKGIEDKQEFWKFGLKHHVRNKLKEYY